MANILTERGFTAEAKLRAECEGFKCKAGETRCCCRRFLFSQPDFVAEKSVLETVCAARGFKVLFLPKFHCELNFIEQCWGAAKRIYRMYPPSTKEDDLIVNVRRALDAVPLTMMRQYVIPRNFLRVSINLRGFDSFARRSWKFIDAYRKGLDDFDAAWAAKEYRGHRSLPPKSVLEKYGKIPDVPSSSST
jgi:hypothetical protein